MHKSDLITSVADRSGVPQAQAKTVIEAALQLIAESLVAGTDVTLTGFGTFVVRDRQPRQGVNPHTREPMHIPASRAPAFSASSALKRAVRAPANN